MYDIHSHILFGVDDGARDIEDSLAMCKILAAQDIKEVIATPHYIDGQSETEPSRIDSQTYLVNQEIKSQNIDITIHPGMEVFISPNIVQLYEQGKIITLNHKNYILIELPMVGSLPQYLDEVIFNLQIKGIKPIIAHPERCSAVAKYPDIARELIRRGSIIQINSGSLRGKYGRKAKKTAYWLLNHNMVHIISSDSHSSHGSISEIKNCYKIVKRKFGSNMANELFISNQFKVINGQDIDICEPAKRKFRLHL